MARKRVCDLSGGDSRRRQEAVARKGKVLGVLDVLHIDGVTRPHDVSVVPSHDLRASVGFCAATSSGGRDGT